MTKTGDRQNVTLSLPKALLRKAKVLAAEQEKSLSELMKEALERLTNHDDDYEKAKKRHLKLLKRGMDLGSGGELTVTRDELHERR